ncbi:MAG: hypothetical protein U0519_00525 [Candidatus Gracilibacteria bacterium]
MATAALQKRNYAKSIRTYIMLIVITSVVAAYYGYTQYQKLSGAQDALAKEQLQITDLQNAEARASGDYVNLKKDFDQKYSGVLDSLQAVYPLQENYTDLARLFDQFFQTNNTSFNPVFVSDLKFGRARPDAAGDYAVLPVTMTITGTQDNFIKFLKFVESSGVLADKTRLMDIRSISINFSGSGASLGLPTVASNQPMINVSVALNAYFQKPFQKSAATPVASAAASQVINS